MKVKTNVPPKKFKDKKGYSKINLLSRKAKDERAITTAEKSPKLGIIFIKSKGKVNNPDTTSDVKKMRRGDALVVQGVPRKDKLVEANYKYKKNLARKKK